MMPRMELADITREVVIGADGDGPGEAAAKKAARAFELSGRAVRIMRPDAGFKDFNAQAQGVRS
jgi:DNA primase